jgi:hypothetical protein
MSMTAPTHNDVTDKNNVSFEGDKFQFNDTDNITR